MKNMKKWFTSILLLAALVFTLGLTGCKTETTVNVDASAVDEAIAEYLVTEIGKDYDKADVCIPVLHNVSTNIVNSDATVYGDYWVENYDIKGDTLEFVSGGNYPGVFKLKINEKGDMVVTDFQSPEDGEGYADSAKKLFGKYYDKADVCIPVIHNLSTNIINNDATVYGDYWVENYDIKGDTLEFVSGGNYPGVFKLKINEKGDMVVTDFQSPEDGEGYADSAKKLFGKYYEDFANYSADDKAKKEVRTKAIAEYVKANGLKVTQYHDYGWDPVALPTK